MKECSIVLFNNTMYMYQWWYKNTYPFNTDYSTTLDNLIVCEEIIERAPNHQLLELTIINCLLQSHVITVHLSQDTCPKSPPPHLTDTLGAATVHMRTILTIEGICWFSPNAKNVHYWLFLSSHLMTCHLYHFLSVHVSFRSSILARLVFLTRQRTRLFSHDRLGILVSTERMGGEMASWLEEENRIEITLSKQLSPVL